MKRNLSDPFKAVHKSLSPPFLQLSPTSVQFFIDIFHMSVPKGIVFFNHSLYIRRFYFKFSLANERAKICLIPFKAVQRQISADSFTYFFATLLPDRQTAK